MAKLGSAEMVGQYSLGLAITAPIFLFLSMKLRAVLATTIDESFINYFYVRLFSSILALFISILIGLISLEKELFIILVLISLVKLVESISDITYGKFQQMENFRIIALSKIARALSSILAFALFMFLFSDLVLSLTAQLVFWVIVLLFYDLSKIDLKSDLLRRKIYLGEVKTIVILSIPLGIAVSLDSLSVNIPRYFISYLEGEYKLGIYVGITYFILIGQIVVTALSQVLIPRFANLYRDNEFKQINSLLNRFIILSCLIGLVGVIISYLLGDYILVKMYSEEYSGYSNVLVVTMIAGTIWYTSGFLNAVILGMRKFKIQVPIF
nr:oligosaccharide flippase family protein [Alkalibacillus haloalkaliphilus]